MSLLVSKSNKIPCRSWNPSSHTWPRSLGSSGWMGVGWGGGGWSSCRPASVPVDQPSQQTRHSECKLKKTVDSLPASWSCVGISCGPSLPKSGVREGEGILGMSCHGAKLTQACGPVVFPPGKEKHLKAPHPDEGVGDQALPWAGGERRRLQF